MSTVVVRHDQPIADALTGKRSGLTVIDADSKSMVLEHLPEAKIFVTNPASWDDSYLDGLSQGDWVQATSTGYAAFPTETFEQNGVLFTNAAGNYAAPVADHAFALALGLGRGVPTFVQNKNDSRWDRSVGSELIDLADRTLTVLGLGDIGEAIAGRGLGFGMDVRGVKRDPSTYDGCLGASAVYPAQALEDLLPSTDLLVVIVPLTNRTHHLIDGDTFAILPDTAILINVARGPVIDEQALIDALRSGEIAGAGLDVFEVEPLPGDSPLWDFENVIISPHVGGRSRAFVDRFCDLFLSNYDRWIAGKPLENRIIE